MKLSIFALSLLLLSLRSASLLATQEPPKQAAESGKPVPRGLAEGDQTDPRKLLMSFYWDAREKRYVQRERMKEVMKNSLKNVMERYQFESHLDQWNHETLEDIHRQYNKAKSNIQLAKHFLIEKMDNIYNNFIQPARWFY
jgi:hypothetical protein